MSCQRPHLENSAWSGEALITMGYELRAAPQIPAWDSMNAGPQGVSTQDLVTIGWSYPRPDFGGDLTTISRQGLERSLTERMARLFDGLRGLSDASLPLLISDLGAVLFLTDRTGESRNVSHTLYLLDLQRYLYGGGPLVLGSISEPFTIPVPPPILRVLLRTTINGVVSPDVEVKLNAGPDGAASINAFYMSQFLNLNFDFQDAGLEAFLLPSGRVSLRLANNKVKGPSHTIEVLTVSDSAYSILGWSVGVYVGVDPIASFNVLCDTVMPALLPIYEFHEEVRTSEI